MEDRTVKPSTERLLKDWRDHAAYHEWRATIMDRVDRDAALDHRNNAAFYRRIADDLESRVREKI
jgi:hypothetical protein